jgi:hypothetical protein
VEEGEVVTSRPNKRPRRETVCLAYLDPTIDLDLTSTSFRKLSTLPTFAQMANPNFQFSMPSLPNQLPDSLSHISLRKDVSYGPHIQRSLQAQSLLFSTSDTPSSQSSLSDSFAKNVYKGANLFSLLSL